jgi:LPXTG-motif cell wall-anchored protein
VKLDSRSFDIVGTAPAGSELEVDDAYTGDTVAKFTMPADETTFSIPIEIDATDTYLTELDVYGQHGRTYLDDVYLDLELPAATSAPATLARPAVTSFSVAPLPLGLDALGNVGNPVELTGTGTPGEYVELFFAKPGTVPDTTDSDEGDGDGSSDLGQQAGLTQVRADGRWTAYAYLQYGTVSVFASQQELRVDSDGFVDGPITHLSPLSSSVDLTVSKPAGTVDAPVITTPAYPVDDEDGFVTTGSGSTTITSGPLAKAPLTRSPHAEAPLVTGRTAAAVRAEGPAASAKSAGRVPKASFFANLPDPAAASSGSGDGSSSGSSDDGDSSDQTTDQGIAEYGIQVTGTPQPGGVSTTVSGTGTPGDHIVVYAEDGDIASSYVEALYPDLLGGLQDLFGGLDTSDANVIPPTFTAGTVASLLPVDDGTITVAANGTWSTTITRKPGSYGIMAFAVDPATQKYSAASELLGVHLTGTPLDPAGSELAFTGSQGSRAVALGGLGAVLAGAGLLVAARRRRNAL